MAAKKLTTEFPGLFVRSFETLERAFISIRDFGRAVSKMRLEIVDVVDNHATLFDATNLENGYLDIDDGVTAPGTLAGKARIYVDTADGDLKVKFGDGTVKTIVVDT